MLDDLKMMLGIDIVDKSMDNLLNKYLLKAQSKFKNYCHRQDIPDAAQSSIVDYAVILYNKHGSEGLSSESYSGVSQTYELGIPEDIKCEWNTFRRVRAI